MCQSFTVGKLDVAVRRGKRRKMVCQMPVVRDEVRLGPDDEEP